MDKKQALKLYIVLSRAHRAAAEMDKRKIRKYGLSQSEFGVLELLYHKGAQPIQQLARKVLLTSGSMTYVVSSLVRKGLIRRIPDNQDRRVFYAVLTEPGSTLVKKIFPNHESFIHDMMNVLSAEDADRLTQQLKHLGLSIDNRIKEEQW